MYIYMYVYIYIYVYTELIGNCMIYHGDYENENICQLPRDLPTSSLVRVANDVS